MDSEQPRFTLAVVCDHGCEPYAKAESERLLKKSANVKAGYVVVDDCSVEDAARLVYCAQTASRVIAVITEGEIAVPEDVVKEKEKILTFKYDQFLVPGGSFRVTCERRGEHEYQGHDLEEEVGALVHDELHFPVDLKQPAMELFALVDDDSFVLGVDLTGRDLGKREYKAFNTRRSLRGTIAAAAVLASGFTGKEVLIDPYADEGVIAIEAGLFALGRSAHHYRRDFALIMTPIAAGKDWQAFFTKLDEERRMKKEARVSGFTSLVRTLTMARANAKLAGVNDSLTLTKCELSWLDLKIERKSVDIIVTAPPTSGKNTPLSMLEKLQDDLFKYSERVLKSKGTMLIVAEKRAEFLNAAERHNFHLTTEEKVMMGEKQLLFLKFEKT